MPPLEGEILRNEFSADDLEALRAAVRALEEESLSLRLTRLLGKPAGFFERLVPERIGIAASLAAETALRASLVVVVSRHVPRWKDRGGRWHRALAAFVGAAGGAFGLPALVAELGVSTAILLHGIADIARAEGEDPASAESGLACLEVFALGETACDRRPGGGEASGLGYHAVRATLAQSVAGLGHYVAGRSFAEEGAPVALRLVSGIAQRFGITISRKLVVQSVPLLGAATGAAVNAVFMSHFQTKARGHFAIRRLERRYGRDLVTAAYDEMRLAQGFAT